MFKKGFLIDLEDSLSYPSASIICSCIENYAQSTGEELDFVSIQPPISFRLKNKLFTAEISMIRGGYTIHCKEN